ncbi:DUF1338 domain-containing protein [Flavobacteriaceae bacterium]|nr:DUF1338 domain-containing protein [Flavobacteriaceae bacterium]MDB3862361.1 DUF1338 domain-containing protein [Flavobacteriaceae bacterium]
MKFKHSTPITQILDALFEVYAERVPDVRKITQAMIAEGMVIDQTDIVNDHVAFRTLGVNNLGIASFEKIFLAHGYTKMDFYHFEAKKLDAYWYAPPTPELPRVFISELKVQSLSETAQQTIKKYTDSVISDPVDALNLNHVNQVASFFQTPLWALPTLKDYQILLDESEYAAWVIYNRYYLNHYTISVHDLPKEYNTLEPFNIFLKSIGIQLNDSGGEIKTSQDGLLRQTSSVANQVEATFSEGATKNIAGSYVEFAERSIMPEFQSLDPKNLKRKHRREGFETSNADKIFESTFTAQLKKQS